jgi:hypothetical protein
MRHLKEITIINLYAPNVNISDFIKHTQKDLKSSIDCKTVLVGEFNSPLLSTGRSFKQKIDKEMLELKVTID